MRQILSDRGSTFYLCERAATDPKFPKYPRLPVLQCSGYECLTALIARVNSCCAHISGERPRRDCVIYITARTVTMQHYRFESCSR